MEQSRTELDTRKKDRLFAGLMLACFLVSLVFLGKDRVEKQTEEIGAQVQEVQPLAKEESRETPLEPMKPMESIEHIESEKSVENSESAEVQPPMDPPLEEEADVSVQFVRVGYDYFDDALLIGDSRMEGIKEYGNLTNATFFADAGMSVFKLEHKSLAVPGMGKLSFDEVLTAREYGKVYLMLGLNELGYKFEAVEQKYGEIVTKIMENQSDAVIYLCANLHVTENQSRKDDIFNNENVNRVNGMIEGLADEKTCVFLDVNELFDDEAGGLRADYSSDAFHIYAKHYMEWVDWLCEKGI